VQVKNKPCVECIIILCLIFWKHSRGSETHTVHTPGGVVCYLQSGEVRVKSCEQNNFLPKI
jgi:hypothetical protein